MRSSLTIVYIAIYTGLGCEPLSYCVKAVESLSVDKLTGSRLSVCVPKVSCEDDKSNNL